MSKVTKKLLLSLIVLLSCWAMVLPANAVYFGYWPYSYTNYWAYPLTSMAYGLTRPLYGLARAATYPFYGFNGSAGYWNPNARFQTYGLGALGYPGYGTSPWNQGVYSYNPGQFPMWPGSQSREQILAQDRALVSRANDSLNPAGAANAPPPVYSPAQSNMMPGQAPPFSPLPMQAQGFPSLGMATLPASAPAVVKGPTGLQPGMPLGASPLASSMSKPFIDRINKNFKGNIKNALFDPETRSMARAVGLVGPDDVFDADLSANRVALAKHILQESSLDPVQKIDALRTVLKR